jgi:hypothetical protein
LLQQRDARPTTAAATGSDINPHLHDDPGWRTNQDSSSTSLDYFSQQIDVDRARRPDSLLAVTNDDWKPDPDYAKYPDHDLHDVPLVVLEAGRA